MKNWIEKCDSKYKTMLLSDENIYHAIYSMESYVFDYNLLEPEDRALYHQLKDKFSEEEIEKITAQVKTRIEDILYHDDKYISAKVFFRPKKMEDGDKLTFRPLHTTDLITQIAIVSMMHLFIYDMTEESQLILSNLSRLIPSNFFGNRVSVNPSNLFKPWKNQYQEYNQKANDALKKYHTSLEYKYEVSLDLENFFPTINPMIIYQYITDHLPAYLNKTDRRVLETVLHKLLFCKLETKLDTTMQNEYCKISKYKETTEENVSLCGYVRGIPQGLPQSYFLGNIYMLIISDIFKEEFPGVGYFYVDDSVIFTNEISEEDGKFSEKIKSVNYRIRDREKEYLDEARDIGYPDNARKFYESPLYGVGLHLEGKSSYVRLDRLDESDLYLKCISREVSQGGNDFFKMYSDEENRNLEKKFARLSKQVDARWDKLEEEKNKLKAESQEGDKAAGKRIETLKKIQDKLNRYYKFFEYRRMRLAAMHEPDMSEGKVSYEAQKKELTGIIFGNHSTEDLQNLLPAPGIQEAEKVNILNEFMTLYTQNIWDVAVEMYRQIADEEEKKDLEEYIRLIDKLCFGKENQKYSYMNQMYGELLSGEWDKKNSEAYLRLKYADRYKSLKEYAMFRLGKYTNKHYRIAEEFCSQLENKSESEILEELLPESVLSRIRIVAANTQQITRMVMNTIYSYLFNVEISDNLVIAKYSRKTLSYGEMRILLFLRNRLFKMEEFRNRKISLKDPENVTDVDYSVMKVVEIFYSFVKNPVWIDNLILTHKYTCDVWKNGSKHLYFYTLHNQEHAITLIQNIVKLVHAIDFIKISTIDFYILFQACYLHDISMVRIPSRDGFLVDTDDADQIAYEVYNRSRNNSMEENDILEIKREMLESYRLLDEYFERKIRGKHADDSASEIRNQTDIGYMDQCVREFVAEISESHYADEREIYGVKSVASSQLVSLKFDKILLRVADLLDMSSYRVSRPILNHNIDQMSTESAFHWISHLLTDNYTIETEYEAKEGKEDSLTPKSITEKLIFVISVNMSQMSACTRKEKCKDIGIDWENISKNELHLISKTECKGENGKCNFLCQWFCTKNSYMVKEFAALKEYLEQNQNNYFNCEIEIKLQCDNKPIDEKQFEVLSRYLQQKNI